PLLEIVTEPDLRSGDEALRFLRVLRQTIVELGISDAEMEKGTLRADVNVSVRERGEEGYRPRWEIKNMNSFTFIGRAIDAAGRAHPAAHRGDRPRARGGARDDGQRAQGGTSRSRGHLLGDRVGGRHEPRRLPAGERRAARSDTAGERYARGARPGFRRGGHH